ncbi:hypothetical protein Bbelb_426840 [Branchiostoma belcheri]|nr:hypothetical protein Bbelb_426840 [Branchiostoma belcheri]
MSGGTPHVVGRCVAVTSAGVDNRTTSRFLRTRPDTTGGVHLYLYGTRARAVFMIPAYTHRVIWINRIYMTHKQWPGMRVPQSLRSGVDAGPDCPDTMFKVCGNTQPCGPKTVRPAVSLAV